MKMGDIQLMLLSSWCTFILLYHGLMVAEFEIENSCDGIKLFAKCVLVVTENIDRYYIKFSFDAYVIATACHLFRTEARAGTHKHTQWISRLETERREVAVGLCDTLRQSHKGVKNLFSLRN